MRKEINLTSDFSKDTNEIFIKEREDEQFKSNKKQK